MLEFFWGLPFCYNSCFSVCSCGCPSDKVAGHGCFGASLMLDPQVSHLLHGLFHLWGLFSNTLLTFWLHLHRLIRYWQFDALWTAFIPTLAREIVWTFFILVLEPYGLMVEVYEMVGSWLGELWQPLLKAALVFLWQLSAELVLIILTLMSSSVSTTKLLKATLKVRHLKFNGLVS
jgi:hypothetical protein